MSVLVRVALSDGTSGEGEIPTSLSRPDETVAAIKSVLAEARRVLFGTPVTDVGGGFRVLQAGFPRAVMTLSGLEVAAFRARLACEGRSEQAYWGSTTRRLETDITIPLTSDEAALGRWLRYAARKGFACFKVKVGGDSSQDRRLLSFVRAHLDRMGRPYSLRLDGNQGFTQRSFGRLVGFIEREGLSVELIEQPLPKEDLAGSARLRRMSRIPILLDESVVTISDLERAIGHGACDGVNIKIAKSGISGSAGLIDLARASGLSLMIGCMTETWVGLSAAVYLASGTGVFDYVDLDAVHFLHGPRSWNGLRLEGPHIIIN
jgi:L-alanine-DL-glutamate epimerase-like enolase superfamily enzyme